MEYNAIDTNPLSVYVMHPFWDRVIQLCPMWIAPNVFTFVGFLITIATFLILSYYDVSFYASSRDYPDTPPIPNWVFLVAAFNVFLAYTLDGIDGKQARRTQTCGPLGELFDHGLDSWSTMFITTALYSVFGRSEHSISTIRLYFVLWNIFINFYLSHWEKYNTGVLYLPWGYDISMVLTVTLFLITGIFGYEIWKFDLPFNISAGHVAEFFFYISALVVNVPVIINNIYKSYKLRTGRMLSFSESMRPLAPVTICFILGTIWTIGSPTNIIGRCPRCVYFMTGTIFSNICCRLIVSQMSSTRCEIFNWLLLPLFFATFFSLMLSPSSKTAETSLLYILLILVTLAHFHYGTCVVRQMCDHFHIYCFRIKKKED
ncbi:Selenoprotein I, putative [Pediculus humanus corporis]|uniref:Selenoprotein I, putative n=1 Tax=Pediculus humanus subsp. corporis TaxID=121224 RepID=E0VUV8_PEDHC|nr:Selenoprotein I, putative [Pediculus humanus corporis]EEB17164.1 Selenoprotein I, putative [Pediculus humanus corporis]